MGIGVAVGVGVGVDVGSGDGVGVGEAPHATPIVDSRASSARMRYRLSAISLLSTGISQINVITLNPWPSGVPRSWEIRAKRKAVQTLLVPWDLAPSHISYVPDFIIRVLSGFLAAELLS